MKEFHARLHRLLLWCYPKPFRDEYGDQMWQLARDRHHQSRTSVWLILSGELLDAARNAPTMRWEHSMHRLIWLAVAVAVVVVTAFAGGPIVLVPLIVIGAAAALVINSRTRGTQPIEGSHRGNRWLLAGAVALVPGGALLVTSDTELSEVVWSLMASSLLLGILFAVIGVVLTIAQHPRMRATGT